MDLTGKKFNRLTVLEKTDKRKNRCIVYKCKCDCGNITYVKSTYIKKGYTKSCGCLQREMASKSNKIHGESKTKLFYVWQDMVQRCKYEWHHAYKYYGGRGITVYGKWEDFLPFKKWSIENGYEEGLTIDRTNVNGNYEPSNCRWVDRLKQANNMRSNKVFFIGGERLTQAEIMRKYNISRGRIYYWSKKGKNILDILYDNKKITKKEYDILSSYNTKEL
jgi:hypothetical protein